MQSNPRRQIVATVAVLFLITFAVFGRALFFDFVNWDDDRNIVANPLYQAPLSATSLQAYWMGAYQDQYMPVTWTTWGVLAQFSRTPTPVARVGGEATPFAPFLFHLLALACHAANAAWVYLLLRRLLPRLIPNVTGARVAVAALLGALAWALHPLQTESAVWVNGGNITYAYFWGLGALYFYLRGGESLDHNNTRSTKWLAAGFFLLALLSKPTTVSLIAVALVLEWLVYRRPLPVIAARLAVWALLAIAVLGVNWSFSRGSQSMADIAPAAYLRPFVAGDAVAFCLQKTFLPTQFAPDYGRTPHHVLQTGTAYPATIAVVVLGMILWAIARRFRSTAILVPPALLVAGLLPTLGLVPFYFQRYSTFADRYAYVALLAPALAVALLAATGNDKGRKPRFAIAGVLVLILAAASFRQTGMWRNNDTLFAHAVAVNPRSSVMWYNRANALAAESKNHEAAQAYRRALTFNPGYVEAWTNLGTLLEKMGQSGESYAALMNALSYDAGRPEANAALGLYFAQRGKPVQAIFYWERALQRAPQDTETRFNLAVAYTQTKQTTKARTELETVTRLRPDVEAAQRLLRSLPPPTQTN